MERGRERERYYLNFFTRSFHPSLNPVTLKRETFHLNWWTSWTRTAPSNNQYPSLECGLYSKFYNQVAILSSTYILRLNSFFLESFPSDVQLPSGSLFMSNFVLLQLKLPNSRRTAVRQLTCFCKFRFVLFFVCFGGVEEQMTTSSPDMTGMKSVWHMPLHYLEQSQSNP